MTANEVQDMLQKSEALLTGHFELSSGLHANKYIQCAKVLQYPARAARLGEIAAQCWQEDIDVVIGPATGGIVFSYVTAAALEVRSIFSERKSGQMELRRGFSLQPGERVLVVEDVVTTGGSVKEVLRLLEQYNVDIIGITSIIDRSGGKVDFSYDFKPLLELKVSAIPATDCKQCQAGLALQKPGSKELL